MNSTFMSKGAAAHVCLLISKRQVRQFSYKFRCRGEMGELLRSDGRMPQLQFKVREYRTQVGVATTFPVAIQASLHVRNAGLDGQNSICYRNLGIVVAMDPKDAIKACADVAYNFS